MLQFFSGGIEFKKFVAEATMWPWNKQGWRRGLLLEVVLMWNRSPLKSFLSTLKVSQWGWLLRGVGLFPLGSDLGRGVFLGSLSGWKIAVKGSSGSLSEGCGIKGERATSSNRPSPRIWTETPAFFLAFLLRWYWDFKLGHNPLKQLFRASFSSSRNLQAFCMNPSARFIYLQTSSSIICPFPIA